MSNPHYYLSVDGQTLNRSDGGAFLPLPFPHEQNSIRRSIILLDRDGVVVKKAPRHQYLLKPDDVEVLPGVGEALRILNDTGLTTLFVTNQPGIHKGLMTLDDMIEIDNRIAEVINDENAYFDGVIFCPHPAPTEGDNVDASRICGCRKPKPGMLTAMLRLYGATASETFMVGDFVSDIDAAVNAGVKGLYVATRHDEYDDVQRKMLEKHPQVFKYAQYDTLLDLVKTAVHR